MTHQKLLTPAFPRANGDANGSQYQGSQGRIVTRTKLLSPAASKQRGAGYEKGKGRGQTGGGGRADKQRRQTSREDEPRVEKMRAHTGPVKHHVKHTHPMQQRHKETRATRPHRAAKTARFPK